MKVPGVPYVQGRNSYVDRDGMKYAIAIHNTSNNASDTNEASYATRRTDGVSSHFYCDKDSVTQSLDTNARAGHAGSSNGNENAISVEITGANGWSRETWLNNVAWGELGRVLAYVCRAYGIAVRRASVSEMQSNPRVKAFYSHDDMRRAWGGTDHTDPGPNFPWDRLFRAVNEAMGITPVTSQGDEDMAVIAQGPDGQLYLCIGGFSHEIEQHNIGDISYVASQGAYSLAKGPGNNAEWTAGGLVRLGWSAPVFGPVWKSSTPGEPSAVDLDALAEKVAGRLGALRFTAETD